MGKLVDPSDLRSDASKHVGSSPTEATKYGGYSIKVMCLAVNQVKSEHYRLATPNWSHRQMVESLPFQGKICGFESRWDRQYGSIVQRLERLAVNHLICVRVTVGPPNVVVSYNGSMIDRLSMGEGSTPSITAMF